MIFACVVTELIYSELHFLSNVLYGKRHYCDWIRYKMPIIIRVYLVLTFCFAEAKS